MDGAFKVVNLFAISWIALEHDARRSRPLRKPERPGAHRMRHDLIAIGVDDFMRHGTERIGERQRVNETRVRLLEPDLKRIPVEYPQPLDLLRVVKRPLVL